MVLRRLNTVAKEVDLPHADQVSFKLISVKSLYQLVQTRESIEKYCEKFEKEMLNLFDRCYRKGDPKMMHVRQVLSLHWDTSITNITNG